MDKNEFGSLTDFIYIPPKNYGPRVLDAIPSKECREYHENSVIQINLSNEMQKELRKNANRFMDSQSF